MGNWYQDEKGGRWVSSPEENGALVRRFIEEFWAGGDLSRIGEFLPDDYAEHNLLPGQGPGLEGYKQRFLALRAALPDVTIRVDDLFAEGDKVVARVTLQGTQQGLLFGVPPTGRRIVMSAINIYRVANGKIAERWGQQDVLGVLGQLGAALPR